MRGSEIGYGRILGLSMLVMATVTAMVSAIVGRLRRGGESAIAELPGLASADKVRGSKQAKHLQEVARRPVESAGSKVIPMVRKASSRAPSALQELVAVTSESVRSGFSERMPILRKQLTSGGKQAAGLQSRLIASLAPTGQAGLGMAQKGMQGIAESARLAIDTARETVVPQITEAIEKAQPAIVAAVTEGANIVRDTGSGILKGASTGSGDLVKGTMESVSAKAGAMQRKTGAVVRGGTVVATGTTKDFFGVLFWLGALLGVITFVFVSKPETRARIWDYIRTLSLATIHLARSATTK